MACPSPSGECLVVLSATLAAQISASLNEDELVVLSALLTALADNLALIAAQRSAQAACEASKKNVD